jgi:hypothetical protein
MGVPGVVQPGPELCEEAWLRFVEALKEVNPTFSGHDIIDLAMDVSKRHHNFTSAKRYEYEEALQVVTSLFEGMSHLSRDMMLDYIGRHEDIFSKLPHFKSILNAIRSDCGLATVDETGPFFMLAFFGEHAKRDFSKMDTTKHEYPLLQEIDSKAGCFMHLDDWAAALAAMVDALVRKVHAKKSISKKERDKKKRIERFTRWLYRRQLNKMKKQLSPEIQQMLFLDAPYLLGYNRQKGYAPHLEDTQALKKYESVLTRDEVSSSILFFLLWDIIFFNNPVMRWVSHKLGLDDSEAIGSKVESMSARRGVISMTSMGNLYNTYRQHLDGVRGHLFLRELIWTTGGGLISAGLAFGPKQRIPMEILLPPRDQESELTTV